VSATRPSRLVEPSGSAVGLPHPDPIDFALAAAREAWLEDGDTASLRIRLLEILQLLPTLPRGRHGGVRP